VPVATSRTTAKILIVDDDEGVTQTFARMLRLEGYQVQTAVSAETGLVEAEESRPDAIILDLRMPLVDGLGFWRLRAQGPADDAGRHRHGDYFLTNRFRTNSSNSVQNPL
jgi:CheY-like chemotaxis protein